MERDRRSYTGVVLRLNLEFGVAVADLTLDPDYDELAAGLQLLLHRCWSSSSRLLFAKLAASMELPNPLWRQRTEDCSFLFCRSR